MRRTVGDLFEVAIQLEETAQALYSNWQSAFAAETAVAKFWQVYAEDEQRHASMLRSTRDRLALEQLAAIAPPDMLGVAVNMLNELQRNPPAVRDLDEAYELAHQLEHSEVNTIFEFLLSHVLPEDALFRGSGAQMARKQVSEHTNRLLFEFPEHLRDAHTRRAIKVSS